MKAFCILALLCSFVSAQVADMRRLASMNALLAAGDAFGTSCAGIGDLNHDGVDDLAVGAPGDDDGGVDRGAVWILFLRADGSVLAHQKISATEGGFGGTLRDGDGFGWALSSFGDLDGDGVNELAVGAPFDDDGKVPPVFGPESQSGAVWILSLDGNGLVRSERKLSATQGGLNTTDDFGFDTFGATLTPAGDWDGDGTPDLIVGKSGTPYPFDSSAGGVIGFPRVLLLLLKPNGVIRDTLSFAGFGASAVANLGDLDGDGVADLLVGFPFFSNAAGFGDFGRSYVVFMNHDWTVRSSVRHDLPPSLQSCFGAYYGQSVMALGDVSGDGVVDVAVGAPEIYDCGLPSGRMFLLHLEPDGSVGERIQLAHGVNLPLPLASEGRFALSLARLGDLDGDGCPEFVAGAPGTSRGSAYVLFSTCRFAPLVTPRGHVANELVLAASRGPRQGETWHARLAADGLGATVLLLTAGLGGPLSGLPLAAPFEGVLLCAPPFTRPVVSTTGDFAVAFPDEASLVRRELTFQSVALAPDRSVLSNALDVVVGSP